MILVPTVTALSLMMPEPRSGILWIAAIILCMLLVHLDRRSPQRKRVAAWAMFAIGSLAILWMLLFPPVISRWWYSRAAPISSCSNNLHILGLSIESYQADHDGQFPDPSKWPKLTIPYLKFKRALSCPSTRAEDLKECRISGRKPLVTSYAMNERLRGLTLKDVRKPEDTVLLFESRGTKLSGGPELLPEQTPHEWREYLVIRHPRMNVLFANGHVRCILPTDVSRLKWDPK